jgi:hypothetical protein
VGMSHDQLDRVEMMSFLMALDNCVHDGAQREIATWSG